MTARIEYGVWQHNNGLWLSHLSAEPASLIDECSAEAHDNEGCAWAAARKAAELAAAVGAGRLADDAWSAPEERAPILLARGGRWALED